MKKLMAIALLFIAGNILAQTPNNVKDQFKTKYPDATNVYWTNEKNDMYRVNYSDKDTKHAVVYDKNGNVVREELEVKNTAVPSAINDYYKKRGVDNSANANAYTVWEVKDKDGNVTYYSDYNGKTAWFDKEGNITTKTGMAEGQEPMDKDMPKEK
jgi:hypothetical protein